MSEEDDTRYRMRPRERTAVKVAKASAPPQAFPVGSDPEIPVIPPLAVPAAGASRIRFGDTPVVVERNGDAVTLVFPGGVRIEGTAEEAATLAAVLASRPPSR